MGQFSNVLLATDKAHTVPQRALGCDKHANILLCRNILAQWQHNIWSVGHILKY